MNHPYKMDDGFLAKSALYLLPQDIRTNFVAGEYDR
jgi:hypothetical protein